MRQDASERTRMRQGRMHQHAPGCTRMRQNAGSKHHLVGSPPTMFGPLGPHLGFASCSWIWGVPVSSGELQSRGLLEMWSGSG